MSHALPIIDEVARLGVRLEARGERLHVDAPKGTLTLRLVEALRAHKAAILVALQAKRTAEIIPFAPRRITVRAGRTAEGAEIRRIVDYSYGQMREDGMASCDWCAHCRRNGGSCRRADLGDKPHRCEEFSPTSGDAA